MNRIRLLFGLLLLATVVLASFAILRRVEPVAHFRGQQTITIRAALNPPPPPPDVAAAHLSAAQPTATSAAALQLDPLVPPLALAPQPTDDQRLDPWSTGRVDTIFAHDEGAVFEPHGDEVCASGCALSRHATDKLTRLRFRQLIDEYGRRPLEEESRALETLLFYGPQTRALLDNDHVQLASARQSFLQRQLESTHVSVALRLIDEHGTVRAWIKPTVVPLDRRHVFAMSTRDLPAQVMSGTVKRVGLNHLWTRL